MKKGKQSLWRAPFVLLLLFPAFTITDLRCFRNFDPPLYDPAGSYMVSSIDLVPNTPTETKRLTQH